jgi:hypothetical protein
VAGILKALALGVLAATVAACSASSPIPSGAQQVHIVVTNEAISLEPATVRAGDVYLVLDSPAEGSIVFFQSKASASATPGPLTDAELARIALGDTQGTEMGGLDAGGCDAGQNAAGRGRSGPCGNAMHVVLTPGKYAILGGSPDAGDSAAQPPMAVLEVTA